MYAVVLAWVLSTSGFYSGFSRDSLEPGKECWPSRDTTENKSIDLYTPFIFLAWLVLLILYIKILREWLKLRRVTPAQPAAILQNAPPPGMNGNNVQGPETGVNPQTSVNHSLRITLMILPVIAIVFFTWLTFITIMCITSRKKMTYTDNVLQRVAVWTITINYFINPYLYGVFHKDLRTKAKTLIKCRRN